MKYYEPLSGDILVDGHSIQHLDNDWLRQNITLVQQESVLFNETIFQNIAFGNRNNATREDVREACKTAYLEETIRNMPNGLDTLIGLGGRSLSGGQKQRVAIARAKLRDAPILILDESTSALDYISRMEVMESIRKWRKGKTTIIITHDMSQILDDDYVYVLDHAKVVQEGYRKKLADKSHGTFASILRSETSSEAKRLSKKPEPSSLTNDVEIPEEAYSQRWSYISKVFGMPQNSPNIGLSSGNDNRLSLKVGVAQASSLSSDLIWPSPHVTDSPQTSIIPRPHLSFMSPRPSPQAPPPSSAWKGTDYNPSPIPSSNFEDMKHGESTREKVPDHITEDAQELPPASLTKIFSTIWPILTWKGKMVLLLGFFAAFIVAAGTPAFAYVFAQLLNVFYLPREDRTAAALKWALSLLAVAVIDGSASFCTHYALEYSAQSWINSLRLEALKRILAQPKSWFDEESNSPGRLNDCLDRNAEEMRNLVGRFAGPAFTIVWMLGITVVWSLIIVWKLTLVALGCAPILYAFTRLFHLVSSKWEERCNRDADFTSSIFSETFTNIRVVRALTLESHFEQKHLRAAADTCKTGISRAVYSGLLYGLTDSLTFFIIALVFYYGTVLICSGSHSLGNVIEVVNLLLFGISNATAMLSMVPQITSSRTTATHMLRLANLPLHTSHETQGDIRVPTPLPIRMNNLSFTHPSQPFIKTLDRISLEIKPGTCTAIVGSSGSGKSTIVSLLLSLYPPDAPSHTFSGPALTFHGIPASSCNLHSLRSHISIVPQSPLLFPTTILENIIYGLPESSPFHSLEAAQRAATHAGIHSFIMSLDAGYSTLIGDGGMGLSGGQTQRLALARALVRRPKLLILDEATSALDGGNAQLVKELVGRLVGEGVAVVLVSHSLEMVKVADCVLVLEKGRIVESGGFEELCGRGGVFGRVMMGGGMGRGESLRVDRDEKEEEDEDIITPVEQRKRSSWVGVGLQGYDRTPYCRIDA
jgi:ATP-binding cassette subfamily B (MDR/TAP) protein 1